MKGFGGLTLLDWNPENNSFHAQLEEYESLHTFSMFEKTNKQTNKNL